MAKKLLPLLLLALMFQVGCSSSDETGAETDASVSEELQAESSGEDSGSGESSDSAATEDGAEKSDEVALEEGSTEGGDSGVVEEKQGDEVVADLGDEADLKKLEEEIPDAAQEEKQADAGAPADGFGEGAPVDQAAAAPPADPLAGDAPPMPETPAAAPEAAAAPAPAPVQASLKKIKDAPFEKSGANLNTVYVAREGDTAASVAQKIYGDESKRSDLVAWNPYIKRGVKTGDKIYYNSPQRPDDRDKMMIFYEDRGFPAETYVSQPGDNIKDLAEKLIGARNSWKELWATNPVESKGKLPPGTELRYWPQGAGDAPPPTQEIAQSEPAKTELPPPPPQANNNLPPPPPADASPGGAAGTVGANVPPPPPPGGEAPAQASKPQMKKKGSGGLGDMDQETTFMLSVGGLLLVGSGVLMAIVKKNRARRLHEGQTQI